MRGKHYKSESRSREFFKDLLEATVAGLLADAIKHIV